MDREIGVTIPAYLGQKTWEGNIGTNKTKGAVPQVSHQLRHSNQPKTRLIPAIPLLWVVIGS